MNNYIVLLRGVNVGGNKLLPMKSLKVLLQDSGFKNVLTYTQSGNIVLQADENPQQKIKALIMREFGFSPSVLVFLDTVFNSYVESNPYVDYEGKTVHFYFCEHSPKPNYEKIDALISSTERFELIANVFYLHAPDGIGRSKLIASLERCLGSAATGRNLNTIRKISSMLLTI